MMDRSVLSKKKIAVVDDHDLIREGLKLVLAGHGMTYIDDFSTSNALLSELDSGKNYDFFILDLELPDIDGIILIDMIRKRDPNAKIIVSTIHDEIWTLRKLLAHDVDAIIYKSADGDEIIKAIDKIVEGHSYYCGEVRDAIEIAEDKSLHPSSRELEVLGYIAQGRTTKEIADRMFVSVNTVEAHRKSLFCKLGAVNAADLIVKSIAKGYIVKN